MEIKISNSITLVLDGNVIELTPNDATKLLQELCVVLGQKVVPQQQNSFQSPTLYRGDR